jgi:hypothetical protein
VVEGGGGGQRSRAADVRAAKFRRLLAQGAPLDTRWPAAMQSFWRRLHWHCLFLQKLEGEPGLSADWLPGAPAAPVAR